MQRQKKMLQLYISIYLYINQWINIYLSVYLYHKSFMNWYLCRYALGPHMHALSTNCDFRYDPPPLGQHIFIYLSIYVFISIFFFIHPSINLYFYLKTIYLSTLFIYQCICLSISVSINKNFMNFMKLNMPLNPPCKPIQKIATH